MLAKSFPAMQGQFPKKEGENMDEMTTPEVNSYLELIAKLVEATAKTLEDAARIVRESKVK